VPERGLAIGDTLTVDFGGGPEVFVFAPVELVDSGHDVITPRSPLGQAVHGGAAGTTVSYATDRGQRQAMIVAID
jgi:transcription elongation factor GreA